MKPTTTHTQQSLEQRARSELIEGSEVLRQTAECLSAGVATVAAWMIETLRAGGKIMTCGNGGSAADAQHFAAELVGRFRRERPGWSALALTVDASILTSLGNDFGFEQVFARQVEALGRSGDILVAISTSGRSPNVLAAVEVAAALGIRTIGLTGAGASKLGKAVNLHLPIPSGNTAFIQQGQMAVLHALCELIEDQLTNDTPPLPGKIGQQ